MERKTEKGYTCVLNYINPWLNKEFFNVECDYIYKCSKKSEDFYCYRVRADVIRYGIFYGNIEYYMCVGIKDSEETVYGKYLSYSDLGIQDIKMGFMAGVYGYLSMEDIPFLEN